MIWFGARSVIWQLAGLSVFLAQLPGVETTMKFVDEHKSESGAWWATAVAFAFLALFIFIGRWGFRKLEIMINDHRDLQKQYIENLKENLQKTQQIAQSFEGLSKRTTDLIEEDIIATRESAIRSLEQTRALQRVEETLVELTRNARSRRRIE